MNETIETHQFQTEARELLQLMIHSVYSNKDIFLRELISNASDAMDRRRFEAVQNPELLPADTELEILLEVDPEARTLTVHDRGIGMGRSEVKDLIGTIAKSGSKEFIKTIRASKDSNVPPELIGQFGVGFYSGFMVADRMTLVTRRAGEDTATRWESAGDGTYTLETVEKDQPGTSITLHLKEPDEEDQLNDYTQEWTLREIVKRYSDFVAYPIKMDVERGEKDDKKTETITLNSMKALWLKDKSEVTQDELNEFYKHISHDWAEPLAVIQAKMEGTLEYRLLLYIPSKAPYDLYYRDHRYGMQLYVKRVFIMDHCKELAPEYLRFMHGVVDSEDLSLNISREILQQDRQIQRMRKGLVGKVLDFLKQLADSDAEKFKTFWTEFGRALKEGIYSDFEHRDRLLGLCRFASTSDPDELTTLQGYIDRMKPEQDTIYYMTGDSRGAMESSPHIEAFQAKGYEVLLLTDPVDEIWTQSTREYEGKKFQNASTGEVDLDRGEKADKEETDARGKELQPLLDYLKSKLGEQVKEVRVSKRLTTSAACLVTQQGDMTPQMEQLMRAMNQETPKTKRVLEINDAHPLIARLQEMHAANPDSPDLADRAELLYGQALLAEGGQLPDAARFAKLVADLMAKAG